MMGFQVVWENNSGIIWLHLTVQKIDFRANLSIAFFGPILDDRLKEKLLKARKGAHGSHFSACVSVCVCVCMRATGHIFGIGT